MLHIVALQASWDVLGVLEDEVIGTGTVIAVHLVDDQEDDTGEEDQGKEEQHRHLELLGNTLSDADSELGYLGRTCFAFLSVRFIFSLSFHDHLLWGRELQLIDIKGHHQGDGVEAILQQRLLGALLREIVSQLHHGSGRPEAAAPRPAPAGLGSDRALSLRVARSCSQQSQTKILRQVGLRDRLSS